MARFVILLRPFFSEECLGFRICLLLLPIGANGSPPVVPNHRGWAEPQAPATLLQTPADIDIVSSHPKARIKTSDCAKPVQTEGHIAARDVFGNLVCEEDMHRSTGRVRYGIRDQSVSGRRYIRTTDPNVICAQEARCKKLEPIGVWIGIIVNVGDDLAGRRLHSKIAGV